MTHFNKERRLTKKQKKLKELVSTAAATTAATTAATSEEDADLVMIRQVSNNLIATITDHKQKLNVRLVTEFGLHAPLVCDNNSVKEQVAVSTLPPIRNCVHEGSQVFTDRSILTDCKVRRSFAVGERNRTYLVEVQNGLVSQSDGPIELTLAVVSCDTNVSATNSGIEREMTVEARIGIDGYVEGCVKCVVDEVEQCAYLLRGEADRTLTRISFNGDQHTFPVYGSTDTQMEVLDMYIVPQTGWCFWVSVSPFTITVFADILTCCVIGIGCEDGALYFIVWNRPYEQMPSSPKFLPAEFVPDADVNKIKEFGLLYNRNKIIFWQGFGHPIIEYEMKFENGSLLKLTRSVTQQHFIFPEYLPYLSLDIDKRVVKNNLVLIGKYRSYWILLDKLNCIIIASKIVGKIHENERAVFVLGSVANVAAGCTTLAMNHLQLEPDKMAIVECEFSNGCVYVSQSFMTRSMCETGPCCCPIGGSTYMQTHDFCAVIDLSHVLRRHIVVCSQCGVIEKYTTKELMKTELSWECGTDDDNEVDDDCFACGIHVDEEDEGENDMLYNVCSGHVCDDDRLVRGCLKIENGGHMRQLGFDLCL